MLHLLSVLQFPPYFTDVASRPLKDTGGQESAVTGHKIVSVFIAAAKIYNTNEAGWIASGQV